MFSFEPGTGLTSCLVALPVVKNKFGIPSVSELYIFDESDTAVEEDILLDLIEAKPDLCLTVRDSEPDEGRFCYKYHCSQIIHSTYFCKCTFGYKHPILAIQDHSFLCQCCVYFSCIYILKIYICW